MAWTAGTEADLSGDGGAQRICDLLYPVHADARVVGQRSCKESPPDDVLSLSVFPV
jgi:hypothetical protein